MVEFIVEVLLDSLFSGFVYTRKGSVKARLRSYTTSFFLWLLVIGFAAFLFLMGHILITGNYR